MLFDVRYAHYPRYHLRSRSYKSKVEHYFSDANLPTDSHLLQLCGGAKNLPVSIGMIMGWRKMRAFAPRNRKLITAALRLSAFLEVVNDKQVRRRKPLVADNDAGADLTGLDPFEFSKSSNHGSANTVEYPPWMTKNMVCT